MMGFFFKNEDGFSETKDATLGESWYHLGAFLGVDSVSEHFLKREKFPGKVPGLREKTTLQ